MHEKLSNDSEREHQINADLLLPLEIISMLQRKESSSIGNVTTENLFLVNNSCGNFEKLVSLFSNNPRKPIVFLTGATGFVGAFLLNELIQSELEYTVICLVRKSGPLVRSYLSLIDLFSHLQGKFPLQ
jgi:hypothetical protein